MKFWLWRAQSLPKTIWDIGIVHHNYMIIPYYLNIALTLHGRDKEINLNQSGNSLSDG